MSSAVHPFYLRQVGAEALLDADEEISLANEVWEARNELAALVSILRRTAARDPGSAAPPQDHPAQDAQGELS